MSARKKESRGRKSNEDKGLPVLETRVAVICSVEEKGQFEEAAKPLTASQWLRNLGLEALKPKQ
jgi:hypothetical protein